MESASRRVGAITRQLRLTDASTGKTLAVLDAVQHDPAVKGANKAIVMPAAPLKKAGVRTYDPGYTNTVAVRSNICYIDGEKGVLRYRGYPIEELAEHSNYLDVAHLVVYGELPTAAESAEWSSSVLLHLSLPEGVERAIASLPANAHPMSAIVVGLTSLGSFRPESNPALSGNGVYQRRDVQDQEIVRILGAGPAIAAAAYHLRTGRKLPRPKRGLSYAENLLFMLDSDGDVNYRPNPRLAKALDVLFVLHAEHEMNCSTAACRHLSSSGVDVYTSVAGAVGALYGPLHGGANEAVLKMLARIGSVDKIPSFLARVKAKQEKLFGFGHRVYKNFDPRAKLIRTLVDEVFAITGKDPLVEVAEALQDAALADAYFANRKLYPNVDFYSGLIYRAMGFPPEFFTCLFAVPRLSGYLAHWRESLQDPDTKILRPQQDYRGVWMRHFVPLDARPANPQKLFGPVRQTNEQRRRLGGSFVR